MMGAARQDAERQGGLLGRLVENRGLIQHPVDRRPADPELIGNLGSRLTLSPPMAACT
jgi:hypothetical protein